MYKKEFRYDFKAKWICAPDGLLARFDRKKTEEFPNAKFIWGRRYTRAYFRRVFCVGGEPTSSFMRFKCDNIFDVFLNGEQITSELRDTGKANITPYLKSGENLLMIRAYQTAVPDSFSSAITGGIHIEYKDGQTEDIVTDGNFENVRFIDFWQNEEPSGWENDPKLNFEVNKQLIVTDLHAIAIKRSCFFRKEFEVSGEIKRAALCATAFGCYEPHINGEAVEDIHFVPGASDKVKEYQSFDITRRLKIGKNAVAVLIGNGWYNCESWGNLVARKPSFFGQITIEYADGRVQIIGTDESWQVGPSPLVDNDLQFGERYDASLEIENWNTVDCNSDELCYAAVCDGAKPERLLLQKYPYIRAICDHAVSYMGKLSDGSFLYDCKINIAGSVGIILRSPKAGQMVTLSACERLNERGEPELGAFTAPYFPMDSLPCGKAPYNLRNLNIYIAKGEDEEYYMPRFSYSGFRYICIKGLDTPPKEADIIAREMHTDLTVTGSFESADERLNRLYKAVVQTWFNNCYNGPTDCPTREKNFWTGDTMIMSHLACFITDCSEFLASWSDVGRKMDGPYGWEDAEYMIPWTLYKFYGDTEILKTKYDSICEFVKKRIDSACGKLLPEDPFSCYNDWLNPTGENLSPKFFSHCWYLRMLDAVSKIAEVLKDEKRSTELRSLFLSAKDEFNRQHYDRQKGEYKEHIQSSCVLPLAFGLVGEGEEQRVAKQLHERLFENGYRLTTGFQASRYILNVLCDYGYGEDAVKLLHQTEFPSWLYMLDTGATNITESWYAMNDSDKSVSMCHFSLGAAFTWFFEYLGGIRIDECGAGFSRIVLEPHCFKALGGCSVGYMTPYGKIESEWHFENGEAVWKYSIPDGCTAEIREPRVY